MLHLLQQMQHPRRNNTRNMAVGSSKKEQNAAGTREASAPEKHTWDGRLDEHFDMQDDG